MSDDADHAEEQEAFVMALRLSARKPVPAHTGFCLNCEEPTDGAFCDKDCRDDFERRNRRI